VSEWFQANLVIDCVPQPLFAAQITFCRLYADMSEQELDLFKLASGFMAEPRTSAPKIVRGHLLKVCPCTQLPHDRPYDLFCDAFPQTEPVLFTHRNNLPVWMFATVVHTSTAALTQFWNRNRSHVTSLADQVDDCPVFLSPGG
jgi:hypothetical protein